MIFNLTDMLSSGSKDTRSQNKCSVNFVQLSQKVEDIDKHVNVYHYVTEITPKNNQLIFDRLY